MKKILLTIIAIICSISIVKAESLLEYDLEWDSKKTLSEISNTYEYKEGYLFVDYNKNLECSLSLYNKKGNLIKESNIDGIIIGLRMDDYIYISTIKIQNGNGVISWSAYNEKLEKINEVNILNVPTGPNDSNFTLEPKELSTFSETISHMINPVEDGVVILFIPELNMDDMTNINPVGTLELRKYKKDLSSYELLSDSLEAEQLYEYLGINADDNNYLSAAQLRRKYNLPEKYNVIKQYTKGNNTIMVVESEGEGFILLGFDKLNKLYEEKLINRKQIIQYVGEIKIVDNHIMITLDNLIDSNHSISDFYIYNLTTGELEKEINSDKSIFNIVDTKRGFLYHETTCKNPLVANASNNPNSDPNQNSLPTYLANENCTTQRHFYAHYNLVIPKIIEGNGQIIVDERQVPGDKVTLTIKPDEGYELGEIKVTDINGNSIKLNDYTFTMPSANVTIEAAFIKASIINPETKDIAIALTGLSLLIATILIAFQLKKIKEMQ